MAFISAQPVPTVESPSIPYFFLYEPHLSKYIVSWLPLLAILEVTDQRPCCAKLEKPDQKTIQ